MSSTNQPTASAITSDEQSDQSKRVAPTELAVCASAQPTAAVDFIEPICVETERLTMLPILDQEIWALAKKHEAMRWVATEVKYEHKDSTDWAALTANERHFIEHILAFFASSDVLVNQNLVRRFMAEINLLESQVFYGVQFASENVHSETYAQLIDFYITDPKRKEYLFNAVRTIPAVTKLADWCKKWMASDRPLGERLFAFSMFEGCVFSGAFCAIYWLKSRGLLPALSQANDFIARDEGLHTTHAVMLNSRLVRRPSQAVIEEIVKDVVEIECDFICKALPVSLIGMNCELMQTYIMYVADRVVQDTKYASIYPGAEMPFAFMDAITLVPKGNFFEKAISEYTVGVTKTAAPSDEDPYASFA